MKHTIKFHLALLVCLSLAGCGILEDTPEVPAGDGTEISVTTDFPALAILNARRMCSGTFITPSTVLTAAHCIKNAATVRIRNAYGVTESSDFKILGSGVEGDSRDIGLVFVSEHLIDESETLKVSSRAPSVGEALTLVGYGCNRKGSARGAGKKRRAGNILYRISDHLELATPQVTIAGLVGHSNVGGTCEGDSGSPLLRQTGDGQYEILGVSHGTQEEGSYQLSLYSDLSRFGNADFIRDNLR